MIKIAKVETFTIDFVCIVKVTAEDGAVGWGQTAPYRCMITAEIVHAQVAPYIIGMDCDNIEQIVDFTLRNEHKFIICSYFLRALGGVETALWDMKAKRAGVSVAKLLGAKKNSYPCYASSMRRDITPYEEAERLKKYRDEFGYKSFKVRVGAECGNDMDEWEGRTEELIPTIRKELGDDVNLLVDGNSCYSPKKAIEVGHMLQDNGYGHFEEPCPYWELDWTKEVTEKLDIDVTGGEQDNYLPVWDRIINEKVVDIVQPDVLYMGGISRSLEVAKRAAKKGLPCTPHAANLSLVTLFTAHLLCAIDGNDDLIAGKYLEYTIEDAEYYPDQAGIFTPDFKIIDGDIHIGETPGWGVEISDEYLQKSNYKVTDEPQKGDYWRPDSEASVKKLHK